MLGRLPKNYGETKKKGITPSKDRSKFSQEKYKFFLNAPFEISSKCCEVLKKSPMHKYQKETGRHAITAQMASESRLRTQKWLQNGCNGFDMKTPISNPMAFWTEQDVLLYINLNKVQIASVYGDVVADDETTDGIKNQMSLADFGIFEKEIPTLKTTGCDRTGCFACGYGCHLEKRPNRFEVIDMVSNPNMRDYCMRGGAFDENGLWKPTKEGLGYWFVIRWINIHGGFNMYIPEYERYEKEYGNEKTRKYLEKE